MFVVVILPHNNKQLLFHEVVFFSNFHNGVSHVGLALVLGPDWRPKYCIGSSTILHLLILVPTPICELTRQCIDLSKMCFEIVISGMLALRISGAKILFANINLSISPHVLAFSISFPKLLSVV